MSDYAKSPVFSSPAYWIALGAGVLGVGAAAWQQSRKGSADQTDGDASFFDIVADDPPVKVLTVSKRGSNYFPVFLHRSGKENFGSPYTKRSRALSKARAWVKRHAASAQGSAAKTEGKTRFGKKRSLGCACTPTFTCRSCLQAAADRNRLERTAPAGSAVRLPARNPGRPLDWAARAHGAREPIGHTYPGERLVACGACGNTYRTREGLLPNHGEANQDELCPGSGTTPPKGSAARKSLASFTVTIYGPSGAKITSAPGWGDELTAGTWGRLTADGYGKGYTYKTTRSRK